jgi:hypothetical protein
MFEGLEGFDTTFTAVAAGGDGDAEVGGAVGGAMRVEGEVVAVGESGDVSDPSGGDGGGGDGGGGDGNGGGGSSGVSVGDDVGGSGDGGGGADDEENTKMEKEELLHDNRR